jgi:hypothetical protein
MFLLRVSLGFLLMLLGMSYLFQPNTILRLNAFMRERLFSDAFVLLNGKRIGATLVAIGLLLLVVTLRLQR